MTAWRFYTPLLDSSLDRILPCSDHGAMDYAILGITLWLAGADIEGFAADLLKRAGADDDFEQAAFIIRHQDGGLSTIDWPSGHLFRKASWSGPVPPGTIAIIHTHPLRMPRPSQIDMVEATRTGLTIYAVTPPSIFTPEPRDQLWCRLTE